MTIKLTLECDGRGCGSAVEIDDYCDHDVHAAGYNHDFINGGQHYCCVCWPEAKKELQAESA